MTEDEAMARSAHRLIDAVQELSSARTGEDIQRIVASAARAITAADGASMVRRAGDQCWYVEEDAIGPLWKGQRFPMSACVSGWSMLHREPVAIPDITLDERVPLDAYLPTFVRSLVMVPIRTADPIGAIAAYWSSVHHAEPADIELLQALANSTAVALEHVALIEDVESRVADRTAHLEAEVEARRQAEVEVRRLAVTDTLTGLYNRRGFAELVTAGLADADAVPATMIVLDLDDLKAVNDALGHAAGDDLLRRAAVRVQATCGPRAIVARLGGDEFAALAFDIGAEEAVGALRAALDAGDETDPPISASIGAAERTGSASTMDDLLAEADAAMYADKVGRRSAAADVGPSRWIRQRSRSS